MRKPHSQGFTLLELIIVIIIVGVLASLALPKYYTLVERARAVEGLRDVQEYRLAMERCYLSARTYTNCGSLVNPIIAAIEASPNAHFTITSHSSAINAWAATIRRNTYEIGSPDPGGTCHCEVEGLSVFSTLPQSHFLACSGTDKFVIIGCGYYEGIDTTPH